MALYELYMIVMIMIKNLFQTNNSYHVTQISFRKSTSSNYKIITKNETKFVMNRKLISKNRTSNFPVSRTVQKTTIYTTF